MADRLPTLAIAGAGFSGTMLAATLLRRAPGAYGRILLIDRGAPARGIAYAERSYPLLLNVPAGRMSARSERPLDFLAFARARVPQVSLEDYLPRSLYGEYLQTMLREAEQEAFSQVRLERVRGEACSIERAAGGWSVALTNGTRHEAQDLVLALGNPAPAHLPALDALIGSEHYVEDPWNAPLEFRRGETVLVLGSGLTMADIVIAGIDGARGEARAHALSRHGLLPAAQAPLGPYQPDTDAARSLRAAAHSIRLLFRATRERIRAHARDGGDWRDVLGHVRNLAPELWQRMPVGERARFLRHVRPYWDMHRHRLPQRTLAQLRGLEASQRLAVHAGRLLAACPAAGRVRVSWRPRGAAAPCTLVVDRVINCTGPDYALERTRDPLLRSLLDQSLLLGDPLRQGLQTGDHGSVRDARGRVVDGLYYLGPMLRATHWECTAAQELRTHAEQLAEHLAARRARSVPLPMSAAVGTFQPEHALSF